MKQYLFNKETTKIELHFEKCEYLALTDEQKSKLKSAFLWSNKGGCWVSRAKEPNLYWAKKTAKELGFEQGESVGERLSFAEQVERTQDRATARAERYEQYAENADKRAENLQSDFERCRQDWSWLTQPNMNTSSGRAFTNQRERIIARFEKGMDEHKKADYFRDRAEIATETASMEKYNDKGFVMRRISECQRDCRAYQRKINEYQDYLAQAERGETVKDKYGWEIKATPEQIKRQLAIYTERVQVITDKQNFLESKLADLGGVTFNKSNIKKGYIVEIGKREKAVEVVGVGTKNITYKTIAGGVVFHLVASFSEITKIIKGEQA